MDIMYNSYLYSPWKLCHTRLTWLFYSCEYIFPGEAYPWIQAAAFEYTGDCLPLQKDERNDWRREKREVCSTGLHIWGKGFCNIRTSQENSEIYNRCWGYSKPWSWNWWFTKGTVFLVVLIKNSNLSKAAYYCPFACFQVWEMKSHVHEPTSELFYSQNYGCKLH